METQEECSTYLMKKLAISLYKVELPLINLYSGDNKGFPWIKIERKYSVKLLIKAPCEVVFQKGDT